MQLFFTFSCFWMFFPFTTQITRYLMVHLFFFFIFLLETDEIFLLQKDKCSWGCIFYYLHSLRWNIFSLCQTFYFICLPQFANWGREWEWNLIYTRRGFGFFLPSLEFSFTARCQLYSGCMASRVTDTETERCEMLHLTFFFFFLHSHPSLLISNFLRCFYFFTSITISPDSCEFNCNLI